MTDNYKIYDLVTMIINFVTMLEKIIDYDYKFSAYGL